MSRVFGQVTCEDVQGNTYQVAVDQLTFRPAVYGVIIQDHKVLLSKQWDGYDFPGGGIELGENTIEALKREVKEETGLEVEVKEVIFADNSFFKLPFKEKFVHSIHLYYECEVTGGEISIDYLDENERQYVQKAEWVDLDQFDKIRIYSSVDAKQVLKKYLRN
ncbi:MAG: NUDIX domain-containing protein [Patescibacteria group bacterium]